jgi:FkbM family methyltransferase
MFSFSYVYKTSTLVLRHPSSVLRLLNGHEAVGSYIDELLRKQKEPRFPITRKNVFGFNINLNTMDNCISPSIGFIGWFELAETELVRKLLRRGNVFVDVGANIGWYTLLSARIMGDKGLVLAYEPEPNNFSLLSKSIIENGFNNVKAFQECVSENTQPKTLWLQTKNLGGHSLIKSANEQQNISVNSTTVDVSLKNEEIEIIDILKIDVEGAEPQVIEGSKQTLVQSRIKNIMMEWNTEVWLKHSQLLDYLLDSFDVYEIIKSPFLIKRLNREDLYALPQVNMLLRLSTN